MYHYARAVALAARRTPRPRRPRSTRSPISTPRRTSSPSSRGACRRRRSSTPRARRHGPARRRARRPRGAAGAYEEAVALQDKLSLHRAALLVLPGAPVARRVRLRQGRLDDAERAFRDSLASVRNNGWAIAGLGEVYKRKGDRNGRGGGAAGLCEGMVRSRRGAGPGAAVGAAGGCAGAAPFARDLHHHGVAGVKKRYRKNS